MGEMLAPAADQAYIELLCPLCEYNLHGLAESRCPECGRAFDIEELRDPARRRHHYLFEHHPSRNTYSFFRTFWGSLFPKSFWGQLRPSMPSNVRRLLIFGLIVLLMGAMIPVAGIVYSMTRAARKTADMRSQVATMQMPAWAASPARPGTPEWNTWLDQNFPLPPSWAFFKQQLGRYTLAGRIMPLLVLSAGWPILTLLTLLIYRGSMRKAKIRTGHVLRAVVYCLPIIPVTWPFLAPMVVYGRMWRDPFGPTWVFDSHIPAEVLFMCAAVLLGLLAWRLRQAYALYLGFDHATGAVAASQVIVLLLVMIYLCRLVP